FVMQHLFDESAKRWSRMFERQVRSLQTLIEAFWLIEEKRRHSAAAVQWRMNQRIGLKRSWSRMEAAGAGDRISGSAKRPNQSPEPTRANVRPEDEALGPRGSS